MTTYTEDFAGAQADLTTPWVQWRVTGGAGKQMQRNGSGFAQALAANVDSGAIYNNTVGADQYSQIVPQFTGPGDGSQYLYLMVRAPNTADSWLAGAFYWLFSDGGSDTEVVLATAGANVFTTLSTDNSFTFAAGDVIKFEIVGATLKVYKNGSVVSSLTVTDATIATGFPGFGAFGTGAPTMDSWQGGDVGANQNVAPGVGVLSATGFAPTIAVSNNQNIACGVGIVTATGFAPTVATSGNQVVAPGVGAITATGFAPTISVSDNKQILPGVGAVTATGFSPSIAISDNKFILCGVGALVLTAFAAVVAVTGNQVVSPGTGALSATGFASTVSISDNKNIAPGVGALSLTGFAATVTGGGNAAVSPGVGALSLSAFAPTITVSDNKVVLPGVGVLTATGFAPTLASSQTFPLVIDAGGHFLRDAQARPFRIQGDAGWDAINNLTSAEVDTYLADRLARGFNTILVELFEHRPWTGASLAPANVAGDFPFLKDTSGADYTSGNQSADVSTPNSAFWAHVDVVLNKIAAQGMLAIVTPCYIGFGAPLTPATTNEGWSADLALSGSTKAHTFGLFLGNRYKTFKNILWLDVGDTTPTHPSTLETCIQQIMQGIIDAGDTHFHTAHLVRTSNSIDDLNPSATGAWDVDSVYVLPMASGGTPYTQGRTAFAHTSPLPAYVIEDYYEGEHSRTRAQLRAEAWGDLLSVIGGYVFGNLPVWAFDTGWQTALASNGAQDMTRVGAFLDALEWYKFAPSTALVTAGAGSEAGGDYCPAALASDGLTAVVYISDPHSGSVTVNMALMGGTVHARWFDPTNAAFSAIGDFANSGTHAFTPSGANNAGANDWVLLLTVTENQIVASGTGALTLTGFAPTVAISNNQNVQPGCGVVTATGFAPTITISNNKIVAPGVGALAGAGFAPTIAVSDNKNVAPGTGAIACTGFAPSVTGGGNKVVAPGVGSLTASGFAPTVSTAIAVPTLRFRVRDLSESSYRVRDTSTGDGP